MGEGVFFHSSRLGAGEGASEEKGQKVLHDGLCCFNLAAVAFCDGLSQNIE